VQSEQPNVTFNKKLYAELAFSDHNSPQSTQLYAYSTVKQIRDQASFASIVLSPQSIKSIGEDFDNDGLVDRWNVSMRVRRPQLSASGAGADLRQASIVLGFNYQTQQVVKMQMETLAVVQVGYDLLVGGASTTVNKITAIGSLDLVQQSVI
jgi:hypothetical protein